MGAPGGEREWRGWLADWLTGLLGRPVTAEDLDRPLHEFGVSSRSATMLAARIGELIGRDQPSTLVWSAPTIADLARTLAHGDAPIDPARARTAEPIAVVGLACRFPGAASADAFWSSLIDGRSAISTVPVGRWEQFAPRVAEHGLPRFGGFLDDIAGFDAEFFGISPREAELMDPQQRLLLEVVWDALAHANIPPDSVRGSDCGVFVGLSATEYGQLTMTDLDRVEAWSATGAAAALAANRVSYALGAHGPSVTTDTACSSSLVAVHLAMSALADGDASMAVVGGVNLLLSPGITATFHRAGALAADGRCKPFDASADGIVRGEGCGVVVLKRLDDARRAGDRILAVLRGSAVNSDGRSNGIMAPNPIAQQRLLTSAYAKAGVTAGAVDYVEAHGTGTLLGDPIEAGALSSVLGVGRDPQRPLLIGSVKGNLGHLEGAAGIAGLIKVVLAMRHSRIPASLNFTEPNPHVDFSALRVVTEETDWPRYPGVARAGVSAFGFGGANAHVVVEEWPRGIPAPDVWDRPRVVALSARSVERLRDRARALADWPGDIVAPAVLHAADPGPVRAAVPARDADELRERLRAIADGGTAFTGSGAWSDPVFVFSGHGSQWSGMARRLLADEPAFAAAVRTLDPVFTEVTGSGLVALTEADGLAARQLALFGTQVAMVELWRSYGVRPAAVIGHSMGEVAAAVAVGALSPVDGLRVMWHRSRLLAAVHDAGGGAMAVVEAAPEELDDFPGVTVAVYGSPTQCTVTGPAEQVAALVERVGGRGGLARTLPVTGAGHSAAVDPMLDRLRYALGALRPRGTATPWYSTVLDDPRARPAFDNAYWAANLRRPVRFTQAVAAALRDGHRAFVEIAPHPVATAAIEQTAAGLAVTVIPTLRRAPDDDFATALAAVHAHGHPDALRRRYPDRLVADLPPPVWRRRRYWASTPPPRSGHPFLGRRAEIPGTTDVVWSGRVGTAEHPWLAEHPAHGVPVLPVAAAVELLLAVAQDLGHPPALRDVVLHRLLPLEEDTEVSVVAEGEHLTISARSRQNWTTVATGSIEDNRGADGETDSVAAAGLGEGGGISSRSGGESVSVAGAGGPGGSAFPSGGGSDLVAGGDGSGGGFFRSGGGSDLVAGGDGSGGGFFRSGGESVSVAGAGGFGGSAFSPGGGSDLVAGGGRFVPSGGELVSVVGGGGSGGGVFPSGGESDLVADGGGAGGGVFRSGSVLVGGAGVGGADRDFSRSGHDVAVEQPRGAGFVLHPELGEAALRVLVGVGERRAGRIGRVRVLGDPRRATRATAGAGGVWLSDADGVALVSFEGVELDEVRRADVPFTPRRLAYQAEWAPAEPRSGGARLAWVLLVADGVDPAEVVAGLGPDCRVLPLSARGDLVAAVGDGTGVGVAVLPGSPADLGAARAVVLAVAEVVRDLVALPHAPRLWIATRDAAIVRPGEAGQPNVAALRGLVRVLAFEHPELRATWVDTDTDAAIAGELTADTPDDETAWRGNQRYTRKLTRAHLPDRDAPVVRAGAYLVSGGLGALGIVVARWLAEHGASRVVLSSRRMTPDARVAVDGIGCEVEVVLGDIAEPGVAERMVHAAGPHPVRGVVHAAGVLADGAVLAMTAADLAAVWWAKTEGALRLHEACQGVELDWWLAYSSAAALFGSPGQAAYATANAWLDAFTGWRRARDLPAATIQWGAWADAPANPVLEPMPTEEGTAALAAVLASGRGETGISRLDADTVLELFPRIAERPFFALLAGNRPAAGPWAGIDALRTLAVDDPERARTVIGEHVRAVVAEMMGLAPDLLPPDTALTALGMDSLLAMRARAAVERDFGATIPLPLLLRGASLADIADHIAGVALTPARRPARPGTRDLAERWVALRWRQVLGDAEVAVDEPFPGDDAAARRLAAAVTDELGEVGDLFAEPTIAGMADVVRARLEAGEGTVRHLGGEGPPVFLFHAAGSPTAAYRPLARLLPTVASYGLERLDDLSTVEEKAARYVELITERQPEGPYRLGGWSFGGILAYETARLLTARGAEVGLLFLIDTILPLRAGEHDELLRLARFTEYVEQTYQVDLGLPDLAGMTEDERSALVMARLRERVSRMGDAVLEHQQTSFADARIAERYTPSPYAGPVLLFRAKDPHPLTTTLDPRYLRTDDALGWDEFCPALEVVAVPGDHISVIDPPHVAVVADRIARELT
ncbi:type I polyketide synthase [Actinokineospora fastidiosa]|uniref:Uncharacterized protein n=1 Tax=Actinokineospora fastidiosa TaxID=1816 RepID=A0A918GND6_9PSEU|nr:type I polyketide synthase [Actinokineospora fastidiosa]GGS49280.1 hypothetical protein GCM10010171_50480 [Actinokineospora fastidiosa]